MIQTLVVVINFFFGSKQFKGEKLRLTTGLSTGTLANVSFCLGDPLCSMMIGGMDEDSGSHIDLQMFSVDHFLVIMNVLLMMVTLPETNSEFTPANGWQRKTRFLSFWVQPVTFQGRSVSFRESRSRCQV